MQKLILLELNELNFELMEKYIALGFLPHFAEFFERHGYQKSISEDSYEQLEPWIQWVSAHSGMSFSEHRIFRLGDIVTSDIPQIWEELEEKGLSVGAVSPMNAANRLKHPDFFIPDPWTRTPASGSFLVKKISRALAQAVNDNAGKKISMKSAVFLLIGFAAFAKKSCIPGYFELFMKGIKQRWHRAIFLDRFLADVFMRLWRKKKPDFATLFLNGAAHIQHHYLFNSRFYSGPNKNPVWYAAPGEDPVLNIYQAYDDILGEFIELKDRPRLILATGLHQEAYPRLAYYYRLKNHGAFLKRLRLDFKSVEPRLSRDFLVTFDSEASASKAGIRLKQITDISGKKIFEIDNRGLDLFVTLTYPQEIGPGFQALDGGREILDFDKEVVFVAIKNAEHHGTGYFMDAEQKLDPQSPPFFIWDLKNKILDALVLNGARRSP